eukprot:SAG31_NODE_505_length_14757_cov_20.172943_17_plen_42_part_00
MLVPVEILVRIRAVYTVAPSGVETRSFQNFRRLRGIHTEHP